MTEPADLVAALGPVLASLDRLGVRYLIGGSVAGSVHGEPRATMDVDIAAELRPEHGDTLARGLGDDYYVSAEMVGDAIRDGGSFNVIHRPSMLKIDVFVVGTREFDRLRLDRRQRVTMSERPPLAAWVATPEDLILKKLEWSRIGGAVSERQLADVVGVIRVQGAALDRDYLQQWGRRLGVTDLLDRAFSIAADEAEA